MRMRSRCRSSIRRWTEFRLLNYVLVHPDYLHLDAEIRIVRGETKPVLPDV